MRLQSRYIFGFAWVLLSTACGDRNADESARHDNDTAGNVATAQDTTAQIKYDPSRDGMLIAPNNTRKLGDSLGIKMYELTLKPGDSIPLHDHPDHTAYVVQGGKAAIYFDGNRREEWDLKPGMALISGPVMDAGKNIGKTTIKMVIVDIYRPRAN